MSVGALSKVAGVLAIKKVEKLRHELIRVAETTGSLTHPEVIALSQELDKLLVRIQQRRYMLYVSKYAQANIATEDRSAKLPFTKVRRKHLVSFGQFFLNRLTSVQN